MRRFRLSGGAKARSERGRVLEQANLQVACAIDQTTVYQHFAICQAHNPAAVNDALEVNTIGHFLRRRQNLAGEFYFAHAQRAAFTFTTQPAKLARNR